MGRAWTAVFAGDPRVWRAAALVAVPLLGLLAYYCLRPRDFYTGTNSVEVLTYVAPAQPGQQVCVPGLRIPRGTARIQFQVISQSRHRPGLSLTLRTWQSRTSVTRLPAREVAPSRISDAVFTLPPLDRAQRTHPVTACLRGDREVNWGGRPLLTPPVAAPTLAGRPLSALISVWYLPRGGARSSYLARAGAILDRAALFRPGFVGPWLYWLMLLVVLPVTGLLALRLLALAVDAGRPFSSRRAALGLFTVAAVNFACWALITPAFQAPDEVDHFAYTQTLVERGERPSRDPGSPLPRWSSSESLLLDAMRFPSDHEASDTRLPWTRLEDSRYRATVAATHPSAADGGGNETAASHGPIYYAALAPGYLLASSSPLSQLTLMRLISALIGALTVLFAFLLGRELAPSRPWVAVTAALLVAFQPMYGFISGAVNNDVGVNAATAAVELLTILILRRGWRVVPALLLGVTLLTLPLVKQTGLSIYPLVVLVLLVALWRHHRRADLRGVAALAVGAGLASALTAQLRDALRPIGSAPAAASGGATASSSVAEAVAHPLGYLAYLWEVFLPRLSFMAPHFETSGPPAFLIFVERGWGAFGWYVILFPHWVFVVIFALMLAVVPMAAVAAVRERAFIRANLVEVGFIVLCPVAVVAGVEAAFYTPGVRPLVAEFGRYAFPAIVPLALVVVGAVHAFGRRLAPIAGAVLVTAMIALSFAGQLVTLTGFYA